MIKKNLKKMFQLGFDMFEFGSSPVILRFKQYVLRATESLHLSERYHPQNLALTKMVPGLL